jgi:hypothetical protein
MPVIRDISGKAIDIGFARSFVAVTPHDTNDLSVVANGLWVSAPGTLSVIMENDSVAVALGSLVAGTIIPGRVKRVRATGTTATVLAMY